MSPPYDAIVVGVGVGGGLASYTLARAGLRVLLIERGPAYDPARDYPGCPTSVRIPASRSRLTSTARGD